MRRAFQIILLLVLLSAPTALQAQESKSLAELMPAKVWAYAEVRQPGRFAAEIQKLFAGSMLGDVPRSLDKLRARTGPLRGVGVVEAAILSVLLAPEMARELDQIQGVGAAFGGFAADGEPHFLFVLQPGKSSLAPFLMRMFLTIAPVHPAETVEGVSIYRLRESRVVRNQFVEERDGAALAMAPDALLLGSPSMVRDAIRCLKGKKTTAALAEDKNFQEAAAEIDNRPGVFAFVNPAAAIDSLDASHPDGGAMLRQSPVASLVNPRAVRGVGMGLSLNRGTLSFRKVALLKKGEKSLVLDALPSRPVDPALLNFAPRDTIFAAAISNGDGPARFKKALAELDTILLPLTKVKISDMLHQLEKKVELDLSKDVIGKIAAVAVAMGDPSKAPVRRVEEKGPDFHRVSISPETPLVVIVQAVDEPAANDLAKAAPRLWGLISGQPAVEPATKKAAGRDIQHLRMGSGDSIYFGRSGSTLIFGPFADPVAQSLAAGSKKNGLLTLPKLAARERELQDAGALLVVRPFGTVMAVLLGHGVSRVTTSPDSDPKNVPEPKKEGRQRQPDNADPIVKKNEIVQPDAEEAKILQQFARIVELEDWLILRLTKKADRIVRDGQAANLDKVIPRTVDFFLEQWLRFQDHAPPFKEIRPEKRLKQPIDAPGARFDLDRSRATGKDLRGRKSNEERKSVAPAGIGAKDAQDHR
ncbi:MAG: DUF3352 domain-containing protein [Planctomycetes bacterium]|nr:DUF3352 domain-containing protein [Planctomycetota bacterium]